MIKVTVINGSPRKKWNTATMLKNFIEGASSTGKDIKTNFFHLYDYKYQGCIGCFACHRKGSTYGKCIVRDDITDLLEMVSHADIVVFGSPIYFHEITAQLRGFLERLIYQYLSFDAEHEGNLAPKSLQTAFIYTMNVTKDIMEKGNYPVILNEIERYVWNVFGQQPKGFVHIIPINIRTITNMLQLIGMKMKSPNIVVHNFHWIVKLLLIWE